MVASVHMCLTEHKHRRRNQYTTTTWTLHDKEYARTAGDTLDLNIVNVDKNVFHKTSLWQQTARIVIINNTHIIHRRRVCVIFVIAWGRHWFTENSKPELNRLYCLHLVCDFTMPFSTQRSWCERRGNCHNHIGGCVCLPGEVKLLLGPVGKR